MENALALLKDAMASAIARMEATKLCANAFRFNVMRASSDVHMAPV